MFDNIREHGMSQIEELRVILNTTCLIAYEVAKNVWPRIHEHATKSERTDIDIINESTFLNF